MGLLSGALPAPTVALPPRPASRRPAAPPALAWFSSLRLPPSQASEPAIALIFPISRLARLEHAGDAQRLEILRLLVAELGRHLEPQRSAMLAIERLPVHLITEERLRMQGRLHIDRLVIIVGAFDLNETRFRVGAHMGQEV